MFAEMFRERRGRLNLFLADNALLVTVSFQSRRTAGYIVNESIICSVRIQEWVLFSGIFQRLSSHTGCDPLKGAIK